MCFCQKGVIFDWFSNYQENRQQNLKTKTEQNLGSICVEDQKAINERKRIYRFLKSDMLSLIFLTII